MAKKGSPGPAESSKFTLSKKLRDPSCVNMYSQGEVSKCIAPWLDEAMQELNLEKTEVSQYWSNVRLGVLSLACAFALYAQFGSKFPAGKMVTFLCVCMYFALSGLCQLLDWAVIGASACVVWDPQTRSRVFVDIVQPRWSSTVWLSLRTGYCLPWSDFEVMSPGKRVSKEYSVGDLFYEDSTLNTEVVLSAFQSLITQLRAESKKKDQ